MHAAIVQGVDRHRAVLRFVLIFPFLKFPVGFAMLLPTAGLVARRIFVRPASPQP
jgi:hypothetical protein